VNSKIDEVNAMTLATASLDALPSARVVLLKEVNEKGFVFLATMKVIRHNNLLKIQKPVSFSFGKNWKDK
jgi:pyridoxamine 5'-phosphate oxidase